MVAAASCATGGASTKVVDDFQPFPIKDQLPGVEYCVNSNPCWSEAIFLGFQQYLVMLGTTITIPTILVPLMGGGNVEKAQMINSLLFVSGISTLLQTWFGTRLPVVMGGSYAFVIPAISIALSVNSSTSSAKLSDHDRFQKSLAAIQGAITIASLFQVVIGYFGLARVCSRFLSPLAAAPLVILTGLGLFVHGFPQVAKCAEVALPALLLLVFLSQYLPHMLISKRTISDRYGVLISVAVAWLLAEILTVSGAYNKSSPKTQLSCRTDRSGLISSAPWINFPYPYQWGKPTFDAGFVFAMMAACLVAAIESTGTFVAASRYASCTPVPPSVLSRGIGWQGIGTLLHGLCGAPTGSTASVENAGLLGLTRVGSRRVVQVSAGFMLFFSILGKFGAVFASIPLPVFGAVYCVLYGYMASAGIGLLQFCHLNSFRSKFILGFSLFLGLSIPQYFSEVVIVTGHGPFHTKSTWFNDMMQVIFTSQATVAFLVAFILDSTHSRSHKSTRRDSGRHWSDKFIYFCQDSRTEEFYCLPYSLNNYFPSF
ncbi:Nucleobase-ascorbate transporter 4 [Linum grandiflorum]